MSKVHGLVTRGKTKVLILDNSEPIESQKDEIPINICW